MQALQVADEGLDLRLRQAELRHLVPGLDPLRVADPVGEMLGRVRQRSGADRLPRAEVAEVGAKTALLGRARDRMAAAAPGTDEGAQPTGRRRRLRLVRQPPVEL